MNFILHLGVWKTASTLIQNTLRANVAELQRRNVHFVDNEGQEYNAGFKPAFQRVINARDQDSLVRSPGWDKVQNEFQELLPKKHCKHIIFSDEGVMGPVFNTAEARLYRARQVAEAFYELLRQFSTQVVIYTRRQDDFLEAMYFHEVRKGITSSRFEDYVREVGACDLSWQKVIEPFAEKFGRDRITVRPYESIQDGSRRYLQSFFDLFTNKMPFELVQSHSNVGFSNKALIIARNTYPLLDPDELVEFRDFLSSHMSKSTHGRTSLFSAQDRKELLAQYEEENIRLFRDYCRDFDGEAMGYFHASLGSRGDSSRNIELKLATETNSPSSAEGHISPESPPSRTPLFITIDAEDTYFRIPHLLTGEGIPDCPGGTSSIIESLNKFEVTGNFFFNVYEHILHEPGLIEGLVKEIHSEGHEIQLHAHHSKNYKKFNKPLFRFNRREQTEILKQGAGLIESWTGIRPIAFRGGAFAINNETFGALKDSGFLIDSSVLSGQKNNLCDPFTTTRCAIKDGILEVPITPIVLVAGKATEVNKWLDLNSLTTEQLLKVIKISSDLPSTHLNFLMHSFSFIDKKTKHEDARHDRKAILRSPISRRHYVEIYRGNNDTKDRLETFLSLIKRTRTIETRTFTESVHLLYEAAVQEGPNVIPAISGRVYERTVRGLLV